jgi:transposase
MTGRTYAPELTAVAVARYLSNPSHTLEGVGKELGVSRSTLHDWVRAERIRRGEGGTTRRSVKASRVGRSVKATYVGYGG